MTSFDPNHLLKLVSKFDKCAQVEFKNHQIAEEICKYCGVCWETHVIKVKADDMGIFLNSTQLAALSTFQNNLVHFFEHFDKFINFEATELKSKIFISKLRRDFEKRAVGVFHLMTRNFVDLILKNHSLMNATITESKAVSGSLIEDLCDGDLEKTLKLVPSRNLARQLGISDQRLRREIYLARQRALKKRPIPKCYMKDESSEEFKSADENQFERYFDLDIPTCASPISSDEKLSEKDVDSHNVDGNNSDGDVAMECDEWSIESLIRSDLFES